MYRGVIWSIHHVRTIRLRFLRGLLEQPILQQAADHIVEKLAAFIGMKVADRSGNWSKGHDLVHQIDVIHAVEQMVAASRPSPHRIYGLFYKLRRGICGE